MNELLKPVSKYLIAIILCELLLITMWFGLAADMDVSRSDSVRALLESSSNVDRAKTDTFLASAAIRNSSRNIDVCTFIVVVNVFLVSGLSILVAIRLRKVNGNG